MLCTYNIGQGGITSEMRNACNILLGILLRKFLLTTLQLKQFDPRAPGLFGSKKAAPRSTPKGASRPRPFATCLRHQKAQGNRADLQQIWEESSKRTIISPRSWFGANAVSRLAAIESSPWRTKKQEPGAWIWHYQQVISLDTMAGAV